MPNSENPWAILVPEVPNVNELYQLSKAEQADLLWEINLISKIFVEKFKPDKLNLGALGNIVPQFHFHIICRYVSDKAWPGAIWGATLERNERQIQEWTNKIKVNLP